MSYKHDHATAGVALIICNGNFPSKRKRRIGASKDKAMLEKTFTDLGFETHVIEDGSSMEILKTAKKVAKADHSHHDCLVVAVSSHGDSRQKKSDDDFGLDDMEFIDEYEILHGAEAPYTFEQLTETFNAKNAPTLKDKPKIFIVQGCRGDSFAKSVNVVLPAHSSSSNDKKRNTHTDQPLSSLDGTNGDEDDGDDILDGVITEGDDILDGDITDPDTPTTPVKIDLVAHVHHKNAMNGLGQASGPKPNFDVDGEDNGSLKPHEPSTTCQEPETSDQASTSAPEKERIVNRISAVYKDALSVWAAPPGYYAFHTKTGSPFIQTLCEVFEKRHLEDDLLTMLTEVNRRVATEYKSNTKKAFATGKKIVPSIEHQLLKRVYLLGKDQSTPSLASGQAQ